MKDLGAYQCYRLSKCVVSKCAIFWASFSAQRESGMQVLMSLVVLFTATQWSGPAPRYEPCLLSENVAGALSGWALESQRAMRCPEKQRQREWQREIDGETDREEAEVCLHLCDNVWPSRPVSSFSGWPLPDTDEGGQKGVSFPPHLSTTLTRQALKFRGFFIWCGWTTVRCWDLTHGHKKKNKDYAQPCLLRGVRVAMQGSHGN